ncbi:MAG: hypothetical protein JWN78_717, partial [Bacteroidota bacterium]|nr:hypothetical protein [Bacteroidota bacterium]
MGLSLTPLLETAISLIVVYFLFSNVISALTESVYALLQVRAGFLKHSIGNLLNEETDSLSKILWNNFKSRLPFGQLIEKIIIWIRKWLSNLSRNNKTVETVSKACGLFNAKQKLKEANEKLEEANKKFSETASEENRVAVLTAKALRDEAAKIVIPLENIVERVYENPIIKNSIK